MKLNKDMKKIIVILILVLLVVGCTNTTFNGRITSFKYTTSSSISYDSYEIYKENNNFVLKKKLDSGYNDNNEDNSKIYVLTNEDMDNLNLKIHELKINKWNGFNKSNKNVLDGNSFSLEVNYDDDKNLTASGYMKYPNNYSESSKKLIEFLDTISNK